MAVRPLAGLELVGDRPDDRDPEPALGETVLASAGRRRRRSPGRRPQPRRRAGRAGARRRPRPSRRRRRSRGGPSSCTPRSRELQVAERLLARAGAGRESPLSARRTSVMYSAFAGMVSRTVGLSSLGRRMTLRQTSALAPARTPVIGFRNVIGSGVRLRSSGRAPSFAISVFRSLPRTTVSADRLAREASSRRRARPGLRCARDGRRSRRSRLRRWSRLSPLKLCSSLPPCSPAWSAGLPSSHLADDRAAAHRVTEVPRERRASGPRSSLRGMRTRPGRSRSAAPSTASRR